MNNKCRVCPALSNWKIYKLNYNWYNKNNKNNYKNFSQTNAQIMEKLKHVSVYKRIMPQVGVPFSSIKSQQMLKEGIEDGSAGTFFQLSDQFQTQADPSYCGPTTMVCIFNSLGVDPRKKWKG
jgi:glutathione gamma-glutamylcysteinyltransferase